MIENDDTSNSIEALNATTNGTHIENLNVIDQGNDDEDLIETANPETDDPEIDYTDLNNNSG